MSTIDKIEQKVHKIVMDQLSVKEEDLKNHKSFVDDLGADSLDTVELVMALEEEFDTTIPDEKAEKITTIQEAIDYIKENLKKDEKKDPKKDKEEDVKKDKDNAKKDKDM